MVTFKDDEGSLLKAILEESAAEVLVFDADTLRILQANRSAARNLQHPLKSLKKMTPLDCLTPEDERPFMTLLTLLRNGKKRRTALSAHCCRRDGTRYPVEARLFVSVDHDKQVFIYIADDVSQREATRQALAHSESDLRAIVANIPGMAYQVRRSQAGEVSLRYVSEQSIQLLGIKAPVLRAHPERFAKLILKEDKADYMSRLDAAGGVPMSFNWEGRIWMDAWKDIKWVNIRVTRRETPHGLTWDGIMLNVTHSKLAEAEIRRSRFQLSALAAHVETIKERERRHLAREVHDDLGGNLAAIKIGLSWLKQRLPEGETILAQRTDYLDKVVDQTIEAAHRISSDLRPAILELGIVSAIDWLLQRLARNTDIQCDFQSPAKQIALSADATIAVFRIVQEALTNVAKHAKATRVKVSLDQSPAELSVRITDNGHGIQAGNKKKAGHGFGMLSMTERATALGGELVAQATRQGGTEITLRIPLPETIAETTK
ncbi:MAG: PAS domain S-box protein [Thiobacillus sp.]|nr:PAS domain S-box protein [Thiobacillus sp.]